MRLRNVPGSREAIADSPLAINEPKELKGKWNEEFGNNNPIRIEIGMGKGKFIYSRVEDRFTTANTGNCLLYMEDLPVVRMP